MTEVYKSKKVELSMRLEGRSFNEAVGWKSRAVTYNPAKDVKRKNYSNLFKNIIKFKCSLIFFSSFINIVG